MSEKAKFPKPTLTEDSAFREWSKFEGCALLVLGHCGGQVEFHHLKRRGARGSDPVLGGVDYCGLALCRFHHRLLQDLPLWDTVPSARFNPWLHAFRQYYRWLHGERERWGGKTS
jgi:hypothetical protein